MHRLVTCCQGAASDCQLDLALQAHQATVQVSLLSCVVSARKLKARHACCQLKFKDRASAMKRARLRALPRPAHGIPGKLIEASVKHAVAFCIAHDASETVKCAISCRLCYLQTCMSCP